LFQVESEQIRYEEMIVFASQQAKMREDGMGMEMQRMASRQLLLEETNARLQEDVKAAEIARIRQVQQLEQTAHASLELLKLALKRQQAAMQRLKDDFGAERAELVARAKEEMEAVEDRLRMWTVRAHRRGQWVETLRTELVQTRQELAGLKVSYFNLQKRRSDEVQTLRAAIVTEQQKSDRMYLWVEAMKAEIYEYEALLQERNRQMEEMKEQFMVRARRLKWETWRHQVAAQHLHTNADALFLFFAQGLANLAGTSRGNNDVLRRTRAVEVLLALAPTMRKEVRRMAAQALGMLGWNGYTEPRMVGWRAKQTWRDWVEIVYELEQQRMMQAKLEFDEPPAVESAEINTAADQPTALVAGRRRWAIRLHKKREAPNDENLKRLGQATGAMQAMIALTEDSDLEVQAHAVNALSVSSLYDPNNAMMGKTEGLLRAIIELLRRSDDVEVQKNAAAAIANIGYKEEYNQEMIGKLGGMSVLTELCFKSKAVDVLETASAALANCLCRNDANALRLGRCDGISALLRLCHTSASSDVVDVSLVEDVQANAAEALANLTRSDNGETAERINRRGVAPLVQMCASKNSMVRMHAPLVLGNIAQNDLNREAVGERGGIEALFLLAEEPDQDMQRNAMWALSNLAWSPFNQERIGCFMGQLLQVRATTYNCW
jgi:hypothetical protein